MCCLKVLAEWLKMGVVVFAVGAMAAACSFSSSSAGSGVTGEERSGERAASPSTNVGASLWDDFWLDFSDAVVVQDSLATADLAIFPYGNGLERPIDRTRFIDEYDALFPDEVRAAFAKPGESLSLEVDGAEVLIDSELQRIPEGGGYPGLDVDITTARVFFVSEFSSADGTEADFHYVFDLVDGEYRFLADYLL